MTASSSVSTLVVVARQIGWDAHVNLGHLQGFPLLVMWIAMYIGRLPVEIKRLTWLLQCAPAARLHPKGANHDELVQTIRLVAKGQALFGPPIAKRITAFFRLIESGTNPEAAAGIFPELTPRELEVLELVATGMNNSAIAEKLVLSSKTVRNHITNIFSKLQVADRAEAIIRARDAGMG